MKMIVFLLTIFVTSGIWSCGSKKEFARSDTVENLRISEQLNAELYRTTRLLELLDIKIRQIERDSSGHVRKETEVDISRKTDRMDIDTTKVSVVRHEEGKREENLDSGMKRSGVMSGWMWIVGLGVVVGLGVLKYKKRLDSME